MPGDKIIREGERGTEMFFIQEGAAEMLIRKPLMKGAQEGASKPRYERIKLEKGDYFGEVKNCHKFLFQTLKGCINVKLKEDF